MSKHFKVETMGTNKAMSKTAIKSTPIITNVAPAQPPQLLSKSSHGFDREPWAVRARDAGLITNLDAFCSFMHHHCLTFNKKQVKCMDACGEYIYIDADHPDVRTCHVCQEQIVYAFECDTCQGDSCYDCQNQCTI